MTSAEYNFQDSEALRKHGAEVLDVVANYWNTLRERKPKPDIEPGSIYAKFPKEAPEKPESFENIIKDIEPLVLAGNTHWHHPHFFAYYPTACSYPSVLADILSTGIACIGFTWNSSPSCTEVEMAMLDWLVKALDLPEHFLFADGGPGGGIIQSTASDSTLVAVLGAKAHAMKKADGSFGLDVISKTEENGRVVNRMFASIQSKFQAVVQSFESAMSRSIQDRLIMYCSDQAHSSVERAALLANVAIRKLETDENMSLRGECLEKAIDEDRRKGLHPFCVVATMGSTISCAFDNLKEIGEVCNENGLWLHVDAAYAGSAMICPEYRYLFEGIELAESFNYNPHKMMLVNFDCSPMWFKDINHIETAFKVDPLYLKHDNEGRIPDFRRTVSENVTLAEAMCDIDDAARELLLRSTCVLELHMQIPLGRRFRSLKIWFTMRSFGVEGIQSFVRKIVSLAKEFEALLQADDRFEVAAPVILGLVCFCLKGKPNEVNEVFMKRINEDGRIHLVPSNIKGKYIIRLAVCSALTTPDDIKFAYSVVSSCASGLLDEQQVGETET